MVTKKNKHELTTKMSFDDTDNKRIGLYVHRSGNATMSIHNTKTLKVGQWKKNTTPEGNDYRVKTITIEQTDGKMVYLKVFE